MNTLFYGDNLAIMQHRMKQASVDLIYLDPPFNSNKNYNLMYRTMTGKPVPEQVDAFCDTWDLDDEKKKIAQAMPPGTRASSRCRKRPRTLGTTTSRKAPAAASTGPT